MLPAASAPLHIASRQTQKPAAAATSPAALPSSQAAALRPAPEFVTLDGGVHSLFDGVIQAPRCRTVSPSEMAARAVLVGGEALKARLQPPLTRYVSEINTDLMAYTNAFLDHFETLRKHTSLTPLQAMASFQLHSADYLQALRGADCGGLVAALLRDEGLNDRGWVAPGLAIQYTDPGVPSFNHMAGLVPFKNPQDPADAGVVLLDPGMHLHVPVVLRFDNTKSNPVRIGNPGLQENMSFYIDDQRIHFERDPWNSPADAQPGREDVLIGMEEFLNYEASVSMPLVAVQDNPRIGARHPDGSLKASIACNLRRAQVNMSWLGHKTHVPFSSVDNHGDWLQQHAPLGDAAGYSAALSHAPHDLASRVGQIAHHADVLAELRRSRIAVQHGRESGEVATQPASWQSLANLAGRTVIYGGSFDPPHMGHAFACTHLVAGRGAEEIWMIPAFTHSSKTNQSAYEDRFAMCEMMALNLGPKVRVSDSEKQLGGVQNSVELTDYLLENYPERQFVFALGADLVDAAPTWPGFDRITQTMPIEIVPRGGYGGASDTLMPTISSSDIRARVKAGESVEGLLPCGVADYIRRHGLFC